MSVIKNYIFWKGNIEKVNKPVLIQLFITYIIFVTYTKFAI